MPIRSEIQLNASNISTGSWDDSDDEPPSPRRDLSPEETPAVIENTMPHSEPESLSDDSQELKDDEIPELMSPQNMQTPETSSVLNISPRKIEEHDPNDGGTDVHRTETRYPASLSSGATDTAAKVIVKPYETEVSQKALIVADSTVDATKYALAEEGTLSGDNSVTVGTSSGSETRPSLALDRINQRDSRQKQRFQQVTDNHFHSSLPQSEHQRPLLHSDENKHEAATDAALLPGVPRSSVTASSSNADSSSPVVSKNAWTSNSKRVDDTNIRLVNQDTDENDSISRHEIPELRNDLPDPTLEWTALNFDKPESVLLAVDKSTNSISFNRDVEHRVKSILSGFFRLIRAMITIILGLSRPIHKPLNTRSLFFFVVFIALLILPVPDKSAPIRGSWNGFWCGWASYGHDDKYVWKRLLQAGLGSIL